MDIAKNVFHLAVINRNNRLVENKCLKRKEVLKLFANVAPVTNSMEDCASSHYWGRELEKLKHMVVLVSTRKVKPFEQGNKAFVSKYTLLCLWRMGGYWVAALHPYTVLQLKYINSLL